ncbi:MAG: VWA domain-containing protein [Vicinamibacterales bacterium]
MPTRRALPGVLLLCLLMPAVAARAQGDMPPGERHTPASALTITSPLGRTGLVMRVRIVAQVTLAPGALLSPVDFYVDGVKVGTVADGPPYAAEWLDENPFERREITVRASVSDGPEPRLLTDTVNLPPFEVVEKAEVTGVLLETSVFDKAGRFVSDLQKPAFTVTEDDVEQAIDFITRETVETDMLLLVDNSQSMARRLDYVRRATERLVSGMRPKDRAIVAPFNAHIGSITGPTSDPLTLRQAIGAMQAAGGTALLDGLVEATRLLGASTGRRAIVLITDGYDENSASTLDDVLRAVQESQVTVYGIAIGGVAGISLKGETTLRRIAEQSGGRVFFPARESELVSASETIATDTHSRYLITYTPANQQKDGRWRSVAVQVPEGLRVRTRAGYYAPPPPPIRPTIEFTIQDAGRNYMDVTAADLDVIEDDQVQTVDTFQEAVDPVSIVLTLDSSGSMKKSADLVRSTAIDFVRAVRPEDSLALITFADKPRFEHVLGTNRAWSIDAIQKYAANGGTALYDALWNSLLHLRDVKGRRSIVLLSDGRDENNPGTAPGSTHVFDEVLALQRKVGATIYAVGLGAKVDRPVLEQLATVSGGQTYYADDAAGLGVQFKRVVDDLRRRYVLSYSSSNRLADGNWRKVEIRSRTPGQVVTSAGGYFAPTE